MQIKSDVVHSQRPKEGVNLPECCMSCCVSPSLLHLSIYLATVWKSWDRDQPLCADDVPLYVLYLGHPTRRLYLTELSRLH